jgi:hypothetical protein
MLKLCLRGQDNLPFFAFLPALSPQRAETSPDKDHTDRQALAFKANRLWAHYMQHVQDVAATVSRDSDMEDNTVTAIRQHKSGRRAACKTSKKVDYKSPSAAVKRQWLIFASATTTERLLILPSRSW